MPRRLLAALVLLALAACSPGGPSIDKSDPFKSLYPWNHKWKTIQKTDHGVEYIIVSKGDGKGLHPAAIDQVEVNYDSRLAANGQMVDSTYTRGEPETFTLNQPMPGWAQAIPGLAEGVEKMQPGDQVMFWIPAAQGYGRRGARGAIPPNSDLMFRVELRKVIPGLSPDTQAWKKAQPWPDNSSTEVTRLPSGLEYFVVGQGSSDRPAPTDNDSALVQYEGRLDDGSQALTTFDDQQPQLFPINQLTPGWSEVLKLMHPGDHYMVRIPAPLLYGKEGDGRIPPDATTTFEIRLMDVVQNTGPPPAPAGDKAAGAAKDGAKPKTPAKSKGAAKSAPAN